jgi:hypothetical protein
VRRRFGGPVVEERARDVLAVEYRHTVAWWVSGAPTPDPHLHSHVVVAGAVREDERIVAVASRPIFRAARELGAFYRSALAEELAGEGYGIERGTGKNGRYFEVLGVPRELCEALSGHSREIARAAERFRARFGRAPRQGELRDPALKDDVARAPGAPSDPRGVWRATAHRCEFSAEQAVRLIALSEPRPGERPAVDRVEAKLTEQRAIFDPKDLRAVALEQTAGELGPEQALGLAGEMVRDRRVLVLEGGRMTTRAVRRQERGIERRAARLGRPAGRDVGSPARESAARKVMERIASPLNPEQRRALAVLTGAERAAVLIGPAGTGKGVVIDAAMRAEQLAGRETFGVAVSWSTAERLGADSPALQGRTMALDSLIARAKSGDVHIGPDTTIVFDEAGMTDHTRLDALTRLVERSGAKLVAVGDGKQLPSIGPGGMFDRLTSHVRLLSCRRSTAPKTPPSSEPGTPSAPGSPSVRWRTTPRAGRCTSRTPATRRLRTLSRHGHGWPASTTTFVTSRSSRTPRTRRSTVSTLARSTCAPSAANLAGARFRFPMFTTASAGGTSSRSHGSTGRLASPASRTAAAARSPRSIPAAG